MRVEVTLNDIRNGTRRSSCWCPVAIAINRVLPNGYMVAVCSQSIMLTTPHREREIPTPKIVEEFVNTFDRFDPVLPIEFDLPDHLLAEVGR